jgi:hypothetical protein
MNDRIEMGVVVVEQIGRNRIDEGGTEDIQALRPADHAGCADSAERGHHPQRGEHGGIIRRSQRGCEKIQDRPLGFMTLRGNVLP